MSQQLQLDSAIAKILSESHGKADKSPTFTPEFMQEAMTKFMQLKEGTEFNAMSMQGIKGAFSSDTLGIAVGVILATPISNILSRFLPVGNLATIIAGLILTMVLKGGFGHSFAKGVLIAGIAQLLSSITGGLTGLFGSGSSGSVAASPIAGVQF